MTPAAGRAFLTQNEIAAQTLTLDEVAPYAEMHSGGLVVLGDASSIPGRYVKMHDTWGPGKPDEPGDIVVHEYNPDNAEGEDWVWYFDSGRIAFEFFLRRITT